MTDQDGREDGETAMLERILETRNAGSFRQFVVDRLDLDPEESVLSVGCGPGFESAALAEQVGANGRVHGVDVNADSLAAARDRCRDLPRTTFARGDATALPVADDRFNAAIAKQVYQFVDDVEAALEELHRVLAPGGRATVAAGDADTSVLHTSDRERARRVAAAYRQARRHPHLGTSLRSLLLAAGFAVEAVLPWPGLHTEIDEQVERGIEVRREMAAADESLDEETLDACERDLRELDAAGEFLSCGVQFCYLARKPAAGEPNEISS